MKNLTIIKVALLCAGVLGIIILSFMGGCNDKLPEPELVKEVSIEKRDTCHFEQLLIDYSDPIVGNFYITSDKTRTIIKDSSDDDMYIAIFWKTTNGWRGGEGNIPYEIIITPYEVMFTPVEVDFNSSKENPIYYLMNKVCP